MKCHTETIDKVVGNWFKPLSFPPSATILILIEIEYIKVMQSMRDLESSISLSNSIIPQTPSRENAAKIAARHSVSPNKDPNIGFYWYSPEACKLFNPDTELHASVRDCLSERIGIFQKSISSSKGWHMCIHGGKISAEDMSQYEITKLLAKMRTLKYAYQLALDHMGHIDDKNKTWSECCDSAALFVSNTFGGWEYPTSGKTIRLWNIDFRYDNMFVREKRYREKKFNLPPLLLDNPDAVVAIKEHIRKNLDGISVENVHEYIHDKVLPIIAGYFLDRDVGTRIGKVYEGIVSISSKEVLKFYGLGNLCLTTVYRWMKILGMKYCERKKNYYVDGHERLDVVQSRWKFVKEYLSKEIYMSRWIQIAYEEASVLEKNKEVSLQSGYHYEAPDGTKMVEYHVDAHKTFQEKMNATTEFGGCASIRKPEGKKMIISFGHDEAIFNKDTFTSRCWTGCEGQQPLIPKTDGMGIMYSALQSREFGFGFRDISEQELLDINTNFRAGHMYVDHDAAKKVLGNPRKKPFQMDEIFGCFVRAFEYGQRKEGYWSYEHLIIQLEDCLDVIKGIYGDEYIIHIMVDHSCGHDRQREDGLNEKDMNVNWGGNKRVMHETKISKGCLGKFKSPGNRLLEIGETQHMQFRPTDTGPYDMPHDEREARRGVDTKGIKWVMKIKSEIMPELWPLVLATLTEGNTGILDVIGNNKVHFDKSKKSLRDKSDKGISMDKARKLCTVLDVGMSQLALKKATMKEMVNAIIPKMDGSGTYTYNRETIYLNRATCRLTTRDNDISMDTLRALCRKHGVSWRKAIPTTYFAKEEPKTSSELIHDLTAAVIPIPPHFVKKNLVELATQHNIAVKKIVEKGVAKSWVGKSKGMLQIAWERGLLNLDSYYVEDFSEKGMFDDFDNRVTKTNLRILLAECSDFAEEESLLQLNVKKFGAVCIHTPKYHCEVAGEGIEYSWGNSKAKYRKIRAKDKTTAQQFRVQVNCCLGRAFLDAERIRKNSRRAREYMVAYFILSVDENAGNEPISDISFEELKPCAMSAQKMETMKQKVRTHRAALDFDLSFCKAGVCLIDD